MMGRIRSLGGGQKMKRQEMTRQQSQERLYERTGENQARKKAFVIAISEPSADWEKELRSTRQGSLVFFTSAFIGTSDCVFFISKKITITSPT